MNEHIKDEKYICNKCGFENKVGGYCPLDDGGYLIKVCECGSGDYAFECCEPDSIKEEELAKMDVEKEVNKEVQQSLEEEKKQIEEESLDNTQE